MSRNQNIIIILNFVQKFNYFPILLRSTLSLDTASMACCNFLSKSFEVSVNPWRVLPKLFGPLDVTVSRPTLRIFILASAGISSSSLLLSALKTLDSFELPPELELAPSIIFKPGFAAGLVSVFSRANDDLVPGAAGTGPLENDADFRDGGGGSGATKELGGGGGSFNGLGATFKLVGGGGGTPGGGGTQLLPPPGTCIGGIPGAGSNLREAGGGGGIQFG